MSSVARFLVEGRVQGVFYRASTREKAHVLGLSGQAINLADGRVEVLVTGAPEAIDALEAWLWQGPEQAQVTAVIRQNAAADHIGEGFRIG